MRTETAYTKGGCLPSILVVFAFLVGLSVLFSVSAEERGLVTLIIIGVTVVLGWLIRAQSREVAFKSMPSAHDLLERDPRPPVLYLRAFDADRDTLLPDKGILLFSSPYAFLAAWVWPLLSAEEVIAVKANRIGPFVALSQPGAQRITGAARLPEFKDSEWKEAVLDLVERSRIIILRSAYVGMVRWELDQLAQQRNFEGVVFWIRFAGPQDKDLIEARYKKMASVIRELSGEVLPANAPAGSFVAKLPSGEYQVFKSFRKLAKGLKLGKFGGRQTIFQAIMPAAGPTSEMMLHQRKASFGSVLMYLAASVAATVACYAVLVGLPLGALQGFGFGNGRGQGFVYLFMLNGFLIAPFLVSVIHSALRRRFSLKGQPWALWMFANIFGLPAAAFSIAVMSTGQYKSLSEASAMGVFLVPLFLWCAFLMWVYGVGKRDSAPVITNE